MQDSKAFFGFIVIGLLLAVWLWYVTPAVKVVKNKNAAGGDTTALAARDTLAGRSAAAGIFADSAQSGRDTLSDSAKAIADYGALFAPFSRGQKRDVAIHTSLYTAVVSSHGGALAKFQLDDYKTWNGYPVQVVDPAGPPELNVLFRSSEGKLISTKDLYFAIAAPPEITLRGDSAVVTAVLRLDSARSIVKRFTFHDGTYVVSADFVFTNCGSVISDYNYQITWDRAMPFAEENSIDECNGAEAYAYQNGELESVDATKVGETYKKTPMGSTNWVAARNKYFAVALISPQPAAGAYLDGARFTLPDNGAREQYDIALQYAYHNNPVEQAHVRVFMGPLDYHLVNGLGVGLESIMSFGWAFIIRPIGIYFMLPVFDFLHEFIPNYGWVIIVFSLLIKALLYPFSVKQVKSTRRMQLLQPIMQEAKDKYKDDPQKMNSAMMRLYKEYGVNPMSGCLPMVVQMPILYAMWYVLRNSIQIRQQPFIWWIKDLATPDVALKLPFRIPIFGVQELSGLAILMGVAMFFQQKMSVQDPRQKAMVYTMPILFTLMFAIFPSGLNLYYLMFNLFSIGQQAYFNKRHADMKLERAVAATNGKAGGKLSFTQRLLETQKNMEKQRAAAMKQRRRR